MNAVQNDMRFLKLIGALIDYPQAVLWEHREELLQATKHPALSKQSSLALASFIVELLELDEMAAQERWLGLFDRGRSMSLLLFEHIHGESRDRGQAMVDLMQAYTDKGLQLSARELPDYLPLVLEYLAQTDEATARDWLFHVSHILALVAARAQERKSSYAVLFEALVEFAQGKISVAAMRETAAKEVPDYTAEAMDKVWEEEAVRFGPEAPGEDCEPTSRASKFSNSNANSSAPHPVRPEPVEGQSSKSQVNL